jgi:hypothetical protein
MKLVYLMWLGIVVVVLFIGGGVYFFFNQPLPTKESAVQAQNEVRVSDQSPSDVTVIEYVKFTQPGFVVVYTPTRLLGSSKLLSPGEHHEVGVYNSFKDSGTEIYVFLVLDDGDGKFNAGLDIEKVAEDRAVIAAEDEPSSVETSSPASPANFLSADKESGSAPLRVTFTVSSWGLSERWIEFGDGTKETITCLESKPDTDACNKMASPIHTYTKPGVYVGTYQEYRSGTNTGPIDTLGTTTITVY